QVRIHDRIGSVKSFRRHSHYRHRVPVQFHVPSHYVRVAAKALVPIRIPKHDHRVSARRLTLIRQNQPSCRRLDAQHRKVIPCHPRDNAVIAAVVRHQASERHPPGRQAAEHVRLVAQVRVVRIREPLHGAVARLLQRQDGQLLRMLCRQGPQEKAVDCAKDRGIYRNPQRQRNHRQHRKPRRLRKRSRRESQILQKTAHHPPRTIHFQAVTEPCNPLPISPLCVSCSAESVCLRPAPPASIESSASGTSASTPAHSLCRLLDASTLAVYACLARLRRISQSWQIPLFRSRVARSPPNLRSLLSVFWSASSRNSSTAFRTTPSW